MNLLFEPTPFWFNRIIVKYQQWEDKQYNKFKQKIEQ